MTGKQAVCALGPRCLMGEIEIRVICMQTRSGEHFIHLSIQVSFCIGIECVMGINCLWPFLKRFSRKTNLREFSSQTAAINVSCWLHKALCRYPNVEIDRGEESFVTLYLCQD